MAFPATPLTVLAEVALGADVTANPATWTWTDATVLVFDRGSPITITRGRGDQGSTADSSTLAMEGDNRGGHWASKNPYSPWFGRLRKGTPVRISAGGHVRFTGFFSELPPRWDVSEADRYAPLKARGLLYRLARGKSPVRSAMRRSITASDASAHWPLEDGANATQAGSALSGGTTLLATGEPLFGTTVAAAGVLSGVNMVTGDSLSGPTGIAAGTGNWELELGIGFDPFPSGNPLGNRYTIARFETPGSAVTEIGLVLINDTFVSTVYNFGVYTIDASGLLAYYNPFTLGPLTLGQMYDLRVTFEQDGANIRWRLYVDGVQEFTGTSGAATLRLPTRVSVNRPIDSADPSSNPTITNLALWTPVRASASTYPALHGYIGEQAHTRFLRLCVEDGVRGSSGASESVAMGAQLARSFLELVRECEASDQGYLYEGLDFNLVLQSHTQRENMTAALALDYNTAGHVSPPLEPTDDDQDAVNDVEVKREGGSSTRVTEDDPAVELSTVNIGPRDDSKTYSLATDVLTAQVAGWRLHMLTWPGYRWPVLTISLLAGPSLITAVCTADLAFRATIANPPDDAGSSTIDLIVDGYSETLAQFGWLISANCVLADPWRVGVLAATTGETDTTGWADFDTCTLHTGVNATAATWLVDASPIDAATSDDLPRYHEVEGELIKVTVVSGSSAPQTWTVTRSVNGVVKAHLAGARIALSYPFILAL